MSNNEKPVILFVFHVSHALTALKAIVFELQKQYKLVGITFSDDIIQAEITNLEQNLNITVLQYASLIVGQSDSVLQRLQALFEKKQRAAKIIANFDPVCVLFTTDHAPNEAFLAQVANQYNIPTILIHWALSLPQHHYDELFDRVQQPTNFYWRIRCSLSKNIRRLLGIAPTTVRSLGGGPAKIFTVGGSAFVDQFAHQGVSRKKMTVTGSPSHDELYKAIQNSNKASARKALDEKLNISLADKRLVLFASQPMTHFGILDRTSYQVYLRSIVEKVLLIPDVILVIKLHPRESKHDYAFIQSTNNNLYIIKEFDLYTAIDACDIFISQFSTTILDAMAFQKPIISLNFTDMTAADYFGEIGGTHHIQIPDELTIAVQEVIYDTDLQQTLRAEREKVIANYLRLDGLATNRILNIISIAISDQ